MGILSALLGDQNPVASWANQNHGLLSRWGAGLASGPTFGQGLANAAQMGPAGQLIDQQTAKAAKDEADRQAKINQSATDLQKWPDLVKYVTDTGDTAGAFSEAFKRSAPGYGKQSSPNPTTDMMNYEYGLTHPGFNDFQTQKGGAAETALTPVWGTDAKGNPVLGQLNKAGQFVQTKLPEGVNAMGPGEAAGVKAGATVDAKTAATARAALPSAEQAYNITKQALDTVQNDPSIKAGAAENFGNVLGIPQQMLPTIPGTNRANFQNVVDQLSGQAFLNIRQALKGAGQVTDYEGQKGEIALSRMAAAAKSGDQKAFQQALLDYNDAIDNGMRLLREQANGGYTQGAPAVTGGNVPSAGKVLTYNPATGELE